MAHEEVVPQSGLVVCSCLVAYREVVGLVMVLMLTHEEVYHFAAALIVAHDEVVVSMVVLMLAHPWIGSSNNSVF